MKGGGKFTEKIDRRQKVESAVDFKKSVIHIRHIRRSIVKRSPERLC
jgi:hypothetical protein